MTPLRTRLEALATILGLAFAGCGEGGSTASSSASAPTPEADAALCGSCIRDSAADAPPEAPPVDAPAPRRSCALPLPMPSASCTVGPRQPVASAGAVGDDGWTWINPHPFAYMQQGIWAAAPDDAWTVGHYGSVLRCGPDACNSVRSGTTAHLAGVWGASADDVWAVGDAGTILHWDGAAWSKVESPTDRYLTAVSGTSAHDVWAIGDCGVALHWDGLRWSMQAFEATTDYRTSLWVAAPDDVWVLAGGSVIHYAGGCWTDLNEGLKEALIRARIGDDPPDASDEFDVSVHELSGAESNVWVRGWVQSRHEFTGNAFVVRWDGHGWAVPTPHEQWPFVWRPAEKYPYATWPPGWVDQQGWETATTGKTPPPPDGWVVQAPWLSYDGVLRYQNGVATTLTHGANYTFTGLWGIGRDRVFAASFGLYRSDGADVVGVPTGLVPPNPTVGNQPVHDIWGTGENDLWAVGSRIVAHFDGTVWTALPDLVGEYTSVSGSSDHDIWAVGTRGIGHWNGSSWTLDKTLAGLTLEQVSAVDPTTAWAVGHRTQFGGAGLLYRWDGVAWKPVDLTPAPLALYGVSALSNGEVWAVGGESTNGPDRSVILHFDGTEWRAESLAGGAPLPHLRAVWAASPDEIWAGGLGLLRRSAGSWQEVPAPAGIAIQRIWGNEQDGLWVAGGGGAVLRYRK